MPLAHRVLRWYQPVVPSKDMRRDEVIGLVRTKG